MSRQRPWIFPGSNMLFRWVRRSQCPFRMHHQFHPNIFMAHVLLTSLPYPFWVSTLETDTSHPLTSACHVGSKNRSVSTRTTRAQKILDFQFYSHFYWPRVARPCYSATTVCFIYLFIQFPIGRDVYMRLQGHLSPSWSDAVSLFCGKSRMIETYAWLLQKCPVDNPLSRHLRHHTINSALPTRN